MKPIRFTDLFSFKGSMGRWELLQADVWLVASYFLYFFLARMLMFFSGKEVFSTVEAFFITVLALFMLILAILALWSLCAVHVRRLHDIGLNGYWFIGVLGWFCMFLSLSDIYDSQQYVLISYLFSLLAWAPPFLLLLLPGTKKESA